MTRHLLLLALLTACSSSPKPAVLPLPSDATPSLRVWADHPTKVGGQLHVQAEVPLSAKAISLPEPRIDGLDLQEDAPTRTERIGERLLIHQNYSYSGGADSYEIPSLHVEWTVDEQAASASSPPFWIDIDTEAPIEGDLFDIRDPKAVGATRLWMLLAGLFSIGLMVAGLLFAFRPPKNQPPEAVRSVPPQLLALQRWEAIRADKKLSDHERAIGLSHLFREYTESTLQFPATAWTTTQNLAHLKKLRHLPSENIVRAKNLLRATDRVKFADVSPGQDLFESLDADLRAFITSTCPQPEHPRD